MEYLIERRSVFFYCFLFFVFLWLFSVYNTSGMVTEKKVTAVELFDVTFVERTKNGVEWVMKADKVVRDDNANKHYFTNIDYQTDPSSDSVQIVRARAATQDGNLKLIQFTGNVHAMSIYPDTSETAVANAASAASGAAINAAAGAAKSLSTSAAETAVSEAKAGFFERGRNKRYLQDNFFSESLEYYYGHKVLISRVPIRIIKPKMEITGDSMEQKVKERRGKVVGNVKITIYEDSDETKI